LKKYNIILNKIESTLESRSWTYLCAYNTLCLKMLPTLNVIEH